MGEPLVALLLDESKWLAASLTAAALAAAALLARHPPRGPLARRRILAALNLWFAVTIAAMAGGHLLAVTIRAGGGGLDASLPLPLLYGIGLALALPAAALLVDARRVLAADDPGRRTAALNLWLGGTLLLLGVHNLPLALPALLNVAYQRHGRRLAGRAILALAVVLQAGLLAGAVAFAIDGRSFEQLGAGAG